jgi:lipoprotein-anchoring transpeptidase ErfK/SrfK
MKGMRRLELFALLRLSHWVVLILLVFFFTSTMQITSAQSPSPAAEAHASHAGSSNQAQSNAEPAKKQASRKIATASPSKKSALSAGPFVNNHYVLSSTLSMNGYHAEDPTVVIVDKGSHSTIVLQLQDNRIVRVLTISNAVGNSKKPTPPGRYSIVAKKKDPGWNPPKTIKHKPVAPYSQTHDNPLGVAAIYLNKYDIDLHGTNDPKDIRKSISHGCVRHSNGDIMRLYNMVENGDTVYIIRRFRGTVLNKSDFKTRHRKKTAA